jgi:hypothetical protein
VNIDGRNTRRRNFRNDSSKIKDRRGSYLGEKIKQAVITVPAYFFKNSQRGNQDAGKIAGLEVMAFQRTDGCLYGLRA